MKAITKLTKQQVVDLYNTALEAGKVLKVSKASGVWVVATQNNAPVSVRVPTKENRAPGQLVQPGDWVLRRLDKETRTRIIPVEDDTGQDVYVWKNHFGRYVEYAEKLAAALIREPLFDTWVNDWPYLVANYLVNTDMLIAGVGIVEAVPVTYRALPLTEEIEIETRWEQTVTGSHWLVCYRSDATGRASLESYDFYIVDKDFADRAYTAVLE